METTLQAGQVLRGRYEIQQPRGPGQDKKVYLAYDRILHCQVVLDVYSDNQSITPGGLPVAAWEAQVLGELGDHRNIAKVLDHWDDGDTAVMVTRYLPGGSLRDLITRSPRSGGGLPREDVLRISTEIAAGLAHIHECGIMYLDLQPRNVLFDKWGTVHLVDFDTAVPLGKQASSDLARRKVVVYVAPEVTDGNGVDERADLYSLGATIYEMASGH
jgi:eukaryotic-like serine/threonine-protein kinase